MKKPHVICHMATSINGKILSANWGGTQGAKYFSSLYEECHLSFKSEAWMCGRVTMEKDFAHYGKPVLTTHAKPIAREPFIGDKAATSFAIAIDAKGKLGWKTNETGGDHIIEILAEGVSDAYLHYLRQKNISYIFAGKQELDFTDALHQLSTLFPIKTIMLEGGGNINGSMLNAGLIDEISILLLPIADGTPNSPTTFEINEYLAGQKAVSLHIKDVQRLSHDVLWLTYAVSKK